MAIRWYIQTYVLPAPTQRLPTDTPLSLAERPGTQFWTHCEAERAQDAWAQAKPRLLPRLREHALEEGEQWHIEIYSLAQLRVLAYDRGSNPQQFFLATWMGNSAHEVRLSASSFFEVTEDALARFQAIDEVLPVMRITLTLPRRNMSRPEPAIATL